MKTILSIFLYCFTIALSAQITIRQVGEMPQGVWETSGLLFHNGKLITHKVSPFPFYSTKWVTEITHVKEGEYFVDEQRFGPYALWHHKHFIKPIAGGVEMEDIIDYKIPFGILGQLAHPIVVKKQLNQIFNYREQKLIELFGTMPGTEKTLRFKSI